MLSGLKSTSNIVLGIFDQDDTARQDPIRPVERTNLSIDVQERPARKGIKISLSPNPLRDGSRLSVTMKKAEMVSVGLYDVRGEEVRTVFCGMAPAEESSFDLGGLSGLAEGLSVLKLSSAKGRTLTRANVFVTAH